MPDIEQEAKVLDEQYTNPVIKNFIGDATRVKIDYGVVVSVNNVANSAVVEFMDGSTLRMVTGAIEVLAGEVWRCRRRFGSWVTDDWDRP